MTETSTSRLCRARQNGVTLPEVLLALAVTGILGMIAVPAMGDLVADQRLRAAAFDLVATLNQARSEAIKRGTPVTLSAAGSSWEAGWTLTDAGGTPIAVHSALSGALRITGPVSLVYERDGRLPQAGATAAFSVETNPARAGASPRCVRVELTGRAALRKGACA